MRGTRVYSEEQSNGLRITYAGNPSHGVMPGVRGDRKQQQAEGWEMSPPREEIEGIHFLSDIKHQIYFLSDIKHQIHFLSDIKHQIHFLSDIKHQINFLSDTKHQIHFLSDIKHQINFLSDTKHQIHFLADDIKRVLTAGSDRDSETAPGLSARTNTRQEGKKTSLPGFLDASRPSIDPHSTLR
ncbi:hypothetical protein EYF80_029764 [Liparis tanakae]|uniref:Uncharacterized protein n=1 Tax=Liparis tanakae TaxID=230148 RepID=A0A4Z2H2I4_9TELE|nr:hypothetical protein EYF80_029764 [Liparis tanakae]